jgi:hypothetical protein
MCQCAHLYARTVPERCHVTTAAAPERYARVACHTVAVGEKGGPAYPHRTPPRVAAGWAYDP